MSSSSISFGWRSTVTFLLVSLLFGSVSACQSCLVSSGAVFHKGPKRAWTSPKQIALATSVSGIAAFRHLQRPVVQKSLGGALIGAIAWRAFQEISLLRADGMNAEEKTTEETTDAEKPPMTTVMVATIGVYKNFISPLLPPHVVSFQRVRRMASKPLKNLDPPRGPSSLVGVSFDALPWVARDMIHPDGRPYRTHTRAINYWVCHLRQWSDRWESRFLLDRQNENIAVRLRLWSQLW